MAAAKVDEQPPSEAVSAWAAAEAAEAARRKDPLPCPCSHRRLLGQARDKTLMAPAHIRAHNYCGKRFVHGSLIKVCGLCYMRPELWHGWLHRTWREGLDLDLLADRLAAWLGEGVSGGAVYVDRSCDPNGRTKFLQVTFGLGRAVTVSAGGDFSVHRTNNIEHGLSLVETICRAWNA